MYSIKCDDFFNVIKTIPSESVDHVIADPPYFLSNGGVTCQSGKVSSVNKGLWDQSRGNKEDFFFHYNWLKECHRVLKKEGTIWVSGTYHSIYDCGFAMKLIGYHFLNDICWYKPNASPNMLKRQFRAAHETIIWARKSKSTRHQFNYSEVNSYRLFKDQINCSSKQVSSVWSLNTVPKIEKTCGYHPTQKPESLINRILLAATKKGDTILDPFMGSGTVGVCCLRASRKYIGVEKQRNYYELAYRRIKGVELHV